MSFTPKEPGWYWGKGPRDIAQNLPAAPYQVRQGKLPSHGLHVLGCINASRVEEIEWFGPVMMGSSPMLEIAKAYRARNEYVRGLVTDEELVLAGSCFANTASCAGDDGHNPIYAREIMATFGAVDARRGGEYVSFMVQGQLFWDEVVSQIKREAIEILSNRKGTT